MALSISAHPTAPSVPPDMLPLSSMSRRQWLQAGLGLGATAALPGLLPALEATRALGGVSYAQLLDRLAQDATTARRAAGPVRLMYNENPYGMSPKAKDALMAGWTEHGWYDPPIRQQVRETFAAQVGVPPEYVLVTQGSSEVLAMLAIAYGAEGGEIVVPHPTFEDLPRYAGTLRTTVRQVALDDRMDHDFYAMDAAIGSGTKLVFVCNPNNPTATLHDGASVQDFVSTTCKRAPVIVDEAYIAVVHVPGHRSMIDLVLKGESVIVSRTASKLHGLAGLRVGFAVARPDIIARLERYKTGDPNVFGLHAVHASLRDTEYQSFVKQKNREGRTLLLDALRAAGRKVTDSQTNFVFFHAGKPASEMQKRLLAQGFAVGRAFPPYTDWCRVSIGTPDEMRAFVQSLPSALA